MHIIDPLTTPGATAPVSASSDVVDYRPGSIVSREILRNDAGSVTVFAFDEGQGMSEHTAPCDAVVHALEGEAEFFISGQQRRLHRGEMLLIPARKPCAFRAVNPFKMVCTMICC
jgi:quercetin dioxygenase-like cupin family protein